MALALGPGTSINSCNWALDKENNAFSEPEKAADKTTKTTINKI
jgi:hypothetical protein